MLNSYFYPMKNTISIFLLTALLQFFNTLLPAQTGYDIRVKINGYRGDSLWFGHTYGKRPMPDVGTAADKDGYFYFQSDEPAEPGLYALMLKRGRRMEFLSCWLEEGQRQFTIEADFGRLATSARAIGSAENEALFEYLSGYTPLSGQLTDLTQDWKSAQDEPSFRAMVQKQEELRRYQADFIQGHPGTKTAALVAQTLFLTPENSSVTDWQAEAEARHRWMRRHYFDQMDLGSGDFMKYPLWVDRTDYYFSKLPPPVPDSLAAMVEEVFQRLQPDTEAYQYYVGYVMNSLARMSRHRTDEAFVHLVRTYLDGGHWDFLSDDRKSRYRNYADRMEPLFVGKKVPDVTLYDREGSPVSLYGVEAPYTLLAFWLYDCGHCKKEMPIVKKLYEERWREKGLRVISVCGKGGEEDTPKCWDFADHMDTPGDWLVVNDPQRRSRFSTLFNVRSYPRLILLDAEKRVLFKQTGSMPEEVLAREMGRMMR